MTNKVALIIGAGDSLGSSIARVFANDGFTVVVARRNGDKLSELAEEIKKMVVNVSFIHLMQEKRMMSLA